MNTKYLEQVHAVASRISTPDAAILQSIGLNHAPETAIADLVDNALDAHAERVLIRFVVSRGLIKRVLIIDDGRGMDNEILDLAFQLGRRTKAAGTALGYFGMGLKAASFSQADQLSVLSFPSPTNANGRRMLREQTQFEVDTLDPAGVVSLVDLLWPDWPRHHGTIVVWDQLRNFPVVADWADSDGFLDQIVGRIRRHLGLTFHRLLARRSFSITIDVFDVELEQTGLPFSVDVIDPFAYVKSGAVGYPKLMSSASDESPIELRCHIWPPGSDSPAFKLLHDSIDSTQGFYFYRRDRLIASGGWGNVARMTKQRRLARTSIDLGDDPALAAVSMEKSGVQIPARLAHAIASAAADDGTTFGGYLLEAEASFRLSNKRTRRRSPMLPAGQGIPPSVKTALRREVEILEGEDPLRLRWARVDSDAFLEVDRATRTLWLNDKYRPALLRGARGGLNDAPLVKTLLFLLFEEVFRGASYGPKDKDNVLLWSTIIDAAAIQEMAEFE